VITTPDFRRCASFERAEDHPLAPHGREGHHALAILDRPLVAVGRVRPAMNDMRAPDGSASDALRDGAILADRLDTDTARLRQEFLAMPALCLTVEQVARLLHVPLVGASQMLAALEDEGFLICTPSHRYRLVESLTC
jgi:hypothetical protein